MDRKTAEVLSRGVTTTTTRTLSSELVVESNNKQSSTKANFRRGKFTISPPTQFLPPELESPNGPFEMCSSASEAGLGSPSCQSPKPAWDMDTLKHSICSARTGTGEVRQIIETCTFKPREQAFTTLINMCGQLRDWKKAVEVFEAMQCVRGVKSNMYTYSALIAACSSGGEWIKALEIFNQMKEAAKQDRNCTPNEFTYSSLITACERGGQYEKALEVYDEMLKNGVTGDHITFSSVLTACEKSKNWHRAETLLSEMHTKGLTGSAVLYSELLLHYAQQGEWNKALSTCLSMQSIHQDSSSDLSKKTFTNPQSARGRSRVKQLDMTGGTPLILPSPRNTISSPSGGTNSSMPLSPKVTPRTVQLSSPGQEQDSQDPSLNSQTTLVISRPPWDMETLKRAICFAKTGTGEVRRAFETCTFRPREQAFTALINMCGRLRDWRKAVEVFEAMKVIRGISPNTYVYSSLIAACSSSGEWEKALGIFETMKAQARVDSNCVPNEVTYSALITACQRGGMFDRALELYNEMIQSGVKPDQITYSSVLAACEKSERWDRVEEILDSMHSQGLCGPHGIYTELITHYGDYGAFNKALQVYMTVQLLGQNPEEKMKKALIRVLEKCEKWDLIIEVFKELQKSGKQIDPEIVNSVFQAQDKLNQVASCCAPQSSNNQQMLISRNMNPLQGQFPTRSGYLYNNSSFNQSRSPAPMSFSQGLDTTVQDTPAAFHGLRVLNMQQQQQQPPPSSAHFQNNHFSSKPMF